jgi:hypothetical protein
MAFMHMDIRNIPVSVFGQVIECHVRPDSFPTHPTEGTYAAARIATEDDLKSQSYEVRDLCLGAMRRTALQCANVRLTTRSARSWSFYPAITGHNPAMLRRCSGAGASYGFTEENISSTLIHAINPGVPKVPSIDARSV